MTEDVKKQLCLRMSDNLMVLRTMLRLSQAELASKIGVSRQTIVALEANKRPISWNTFLSLLLVFSKNQNTNQLLKLYEIYTDELEDYLFVGIKEEVPLLEESQICN